VYCFKDDSGCRVEKTEEERKGRKRRGVTHPE